MRRMCRSKWFLPLFGVLLGVVTLAAQSIGGHTGDGLVSLAIMVGDGEPYVWLGALAGLTYLVAIAVLRFRS